MLKRLLFYKIHKQLRHKNALVITGMRQVGKTTLLRQIFSEIESPAKLWFDFDNPIDTKIFEDIDYRTIYTRLRQQAGNKSVRLQVFIDEIQNFPGITKIIKYLIDNYQVKFMVTGSSNFYLKNLFPESLSGRKFLYDLAPLSFREYLYFKGKISLAQAQLSSWSQAVKQMDIFEYKRREADYDDYLKYGGFPEVALTEDPATKEEIIKNIFKSFFEKDIRILSDQSDIRELRDLLMLLVPRVGSMLDVSRLASELGVARVKIYNYLEFLQGTFVIRLLSKYSQSIDRSVASGKKVYFSDTGLLQAIGSVNDAQLLENAVINQLADYGNLSFYNRRQIAEIDAILDKKVALEIKNKGTENDFKKLQRLSAELNFKNCLVISKNWVDGKNFIYPQQL